MSSPEKFQEHWQNLMSMPSIWPTTNLLVSMMNFVIQNWAIRRLILVA
jgi:hypothetical protein